MAGLLDYIYGEQGPFGLRPDGSKKGYGYLGLLSDLKHGGVMTELTAESDGLNYPLIVPTLTRGEQMQLQLGEHPTQEMYRKAIQHAIQRMRNGQSVYAE